MPDRVRFNQGFSAVPDELIEDDRTTVYHIAIFAVIAKHANTESRAWPSHNRLSKLTGASRRKVIDTIAQLEQMGWLVKRKRWDEERGAYTSNVYELQRSLQGSAHGARGVVHEVHRGSAPRAQELDPENQTQENHSMSGKPDHSPTAEADAIIDYLNTKAEKRYRHTSTNRKIITARLREGFTQQDCETVIDTMVSHWKDDEMMNRYLRPETLFRASKFEGYLNMEPAKSKDDLDGYVLVNGTYYDKRTAPR